jgi:SAM-dependent methyltransferase
MAFDRDYYQRFYFNPRTAVTSRAEMRARARLIAACVQYVGLPVGRILDAGCGVGLLRAPLKRALRTADYIGLEFSEYLCRRYGWRQGSIATLRTRERFDLVICYDVLQYLPAAQARRAIANLARVCRGALYFGALTLEDWRDNCDQTRTDRIPGLRRGAWYRRELARAFTPMGCGMWLKRGLPVTLWNLDVCAK